MLHWEEWFRWWALENYFAVSERTSKAIISISNILFVLTNA